MSGAKRNGETPWFLLWTKHPDAPVIHDQTWLTAAELDETSRQAAGALRQSGLMPGDRVVMSAAASKDLVAMHIGALRAGLVVVPANTAYTPKELDHIRTDSGAKATVLDDPSRGPCIPVDARAEPVNDHPIAPDTPAMICYTSGTTGKSKGAVLTHGNLHASAAAVAETWRWTAADRLVLALPLFHMHGLGVGVHGTLLTGASMILVRFDPDTVFDAIAEHAATMLFGVPTMYARLADHPRVAELGRLRLCVSGSAPLAADLHRRLRAATGQPVLERYGMTETVMLTSNPYVGERKPGSVGLPLPSVEVRLARSGEIEVRGPNVFPGYWRDDAATQACFTDDGWFRTGDVGAFDEDGYLFIVGRSKELIITGGYNVYPREVEEALQSYPGVGEAAVVGMPDPEWGEVVTAFVVAEPSVTEQDLKQHAAGVLAKYKQPRRVIFTETIPRNAMGKVDRLVLAARLA